VLQSIDFSFPLEVPPGWSELTTPGIRRDALQGRADLLSALAEYEASESALRLEIARQYPDIHLGSNYQWDQGENKWQLGVTFELPVLNRNQGPIAEANAKRSEAGARFTALQARAIGEIDRATATRDAVLDQLKEAERIVEAHREQLSTLEASLKAGAADRVEVETVALELRSSELVLLDLKIKAQQALGLLEDALQRPFASLRNIEIDPKQPATKKEAKK
jgi:outer membrane protein TolC